MNNSLRVLIVEDSEDDALLLVRELRKGGYDVASKRVDSAESLKAQLSGGEWDLIVSDYVLPGFSGPAALEVMREHGLDLPFIIVSGKIDEATAVAAMKAGAHDYVVKGNLARLVPAVQRELREAEIRRRQAAIASALRESEERQRVVFDNSPVAILAKDLEGRYILLNPQAERWMGLSREDALGKTDYDLWPAELADIIRVNDERALRVGGAVEVEEHIPRPGGTRVLLVAKFPLTDSHGRPYGVCGVATDITERKRAEVALRQSRDELLRTNRELQALYEREHRIAATLQRSLVPDIPASAGEFELARYYAPALQEAEVGGDFYDFFRIDDTRYGVVIGDVAGKGLRAAVGSTTARYALRAFALEDPEPEAVIRRTNDTLSMSLEDETFITLLFGVLDTRASELVLANAGHEPPALYHSRTRTHELVRIPGIAAGVQAGMSFESRRIAFEPGDSVLFYTDGVTEARRDGEFFGRERVALSLAGACSNGCSASSAVENVRNSVVAFAEGKLRDDVALLAIRRR